MKEICYKKTEFLLPWKWRKKNLLHRFILDIPYALYFPVVPSENALNEVLLKGAAGGGMGTGLIWDPFEMTTDEYNSVLDEWKNFDLREIPQKNVIATSFIFDEEIMSIPHHLDYLKRSREKFKPRFLT